VEYPDIAGIGFLPCTNTNASFRIVVFYADKSFYIWDRDVSGGYRMLYRSFGIPGRLLDSKVGKL
jgi:hypothetical protein